LAADTIYVSNYGDSTVTRITADGQKQTYASGLHLPYGLAFDALGNLLCASGQTNQVYSLDKTGMARAYGSGPRYANLTGLAFDAQGNLYAADQKELVAYCASYTSASQLAIKGEGLRCLCFIKSHSASVGLW
jgi:sugar lactone lactonase YvrE